MALPTATHRNHLQGGAVALLAAVGAHTRTRALPELLDAFGVVSTLRDLDADLASGICNVPAEVVGEARWDRLQELRRVRAWMEAERALALEALATTEGRLAALGDPMAERVLGFFLPSMRRILSRAVT